MKHRLGVLFRKLHFKVSTESRIDFFLKPRTPSRHFILDKNPYIRLHRWLVFKSHSPNVDSTFASKNCTSRTAMKADSTFPKSLKRRHSVYFWKKIPNLRVHHQLVFKSNPPNTDLASVTANCLNSSSYVVLYSVQVTKISIISTLMRTRIHQRTH